MRKLKIVGTLASIGLCLAMLVLGVYAATTVSFDISGSVSFVVTDVFVDIEGKVYLDPVATKGTTQVGETFSSKSYVGTTPSDLTNKTWNIGTTVFTSTKDCIVYTLKITNSAKSGSVNVIISSLPFAIEGTSLESVYALHGGAEVPLVDTAPIGVDAGSHVLITITRTLTEKAKAIDSTLAWSPTVTIENDGLLNTIFKPTVSVSNEHNDTLSISAKETQALSTLPTESDFTVDAGSIEGVDGANITLTGAKLNDVNKYYSFKLTINASYLAVYGNQEGTIIGDGYKVTWTYDGDDYEGEDFANLRESGFITCLFELTDFSKEVEVLSEHSTLVLTTGNFHGGASD